MEPGKELDVLIAEKIMGGKIHENFHVEWPPMRGIFKLPEYSTSIDSAWQVVDKLKEKMCELTFDFGYDDRIWATFTVAGIYDELHPSFQAEGETAAHSICLAALLYVGHKV